MVGRRNSIDWPRIEIEYLSGEDSIREIADRHAISDTAIRKRARAEGWPKPVRSANCRELPPPVPPARRDPDAPVDPAAIADAGRNLIARMLDELDTVTGHQAELTELITAASTGEDEDARRDAVQRATSLPSRTASLKTLALALKTLNEASAPAGKKAARQDKAKEIGAAPRFAGLGPPTLKAVK